MAKSRSNRVRIIGGGLRGRVVNFVDASGLRPSGDRLRETLFSWLQPDLPDSTCLDMFAGSGVLGFEALSRGADEVFLLENNRKVCEQLRQSAAQLKLDSAHVHCIDSTVAALLPVPAAGEFTVVFIDPPFAENLHSTAIQCLLESRLLARGALIAIESNKRGDDIVVPVDWQLIKDKVAGEVRLRLYQNQTQLPD